jgi:hypothetical protein
MKLVLMQGEEEEISDYMKTMKKVREYQSPKPGLTLGDYLRIGICRS